MRNAIILILFTPLITGCSHYKWYAKHQNELCAKCPQEVTTDNSQVDTVIYGEVAPDTIRIYGLDTITNTVIVDNPVYKIIKEKGEVKVVIKERRVPFTVTKYRTANDKVKIIETKVKYVPFWYWLLIPFIFLAGFYLRRFIWR